MDDDHRVRERHEQLVAAKENGRLENRRTKLARENEAAGGLHASEERPVFDRRNLTCGHGRNEPRGSACVERAFVRRGVDADRATGHDHDALSDRERRQVTRECGGFGQSSAASDDGERTRACARNGAKTGEAVDEVLGKVRRKKVRGAHPFSIEARSQILRVECIKMSFMTRRALFSRHRHAHEPSR